MSTPTRPTGAVTHPAAQAVAAKKDIRDFIQSPQMLQQMALVLPKHITADRMARVALTALLKTPKLLECSRESLLQALMNCSQAGLEPDGRHAHLIPYGNIVQLIIDYKGLVELAMRSGVVSNIHADVVCNEDVFKYDRGELKTHEIDFRKERGAMYAVYALVRFKDGTEKCEVMTKAEVDGIRARSRAAKAGPWVTDYNEMAKKTVFRRLSKWITLSPEFRDAVEKDDDRLPEIDPPMIPVKPLFEDKPSETAGKTGGTNMPADPDPEPDPEPEPEPAPADAAPASTPAAAGPAAVPDSRELRAMPGLLKLGGVTEVEVIGFLHATGMDDSLTTFSDVATAAPERLKYVHDNWSEVTKNIKGARPKEGQLV